MMLKIIFNKIVILAITLFLVACSTKESPKIIDIEPSIHINQLAFELSGPKSAIITSPVNSDLNELTFTVHLTNQVDSVFQGKLEKLSVFDEWQAANKDLQRVYHYRADFSALKQAGNFQLAFIHQGQKILSSSFFIDEQALFKHTASALLDYFNGSRNDEEYNYQQDQNIRIFGTQRYVDVRGGYNDAGGDSGKYLSHLSYANYFNPQQLAHVTWALGYSYQAIPHLYDELTLTSQIQSEIFWGADYLHRILDPEGYFYMTVFDQWGTNNAERVITAYVGADGDYTEDYQSAFRQGAGSAIAALARAAMIADATGKQGEYSAKQYLADAEKAFRHLMQNNADYCDDGKENIIDDYTALLAATELYRATEDNYYLEAARERANNLAGRLSAEGWFISNDINSDNLRPFYHAAEAGFPIVSLSQYLTIETNAGEISQAKQVIAKHLAYQLELNAKVSNPFNYARQSFKRYNNGILSSEHQEGFFIPHANETNYWWQGESARLSSLTMAAIIGRKGIDNEQHKIELANFAQNQMDWTLGRNPYDISMLNGFGVKNPIPYEGLGMFKGGISNGITGSKNDDDGRGIEFAPETDWHNWRWVEQWLPHSTWFLLAATEMAK
ncbi:glycoside hydrolase family 9 protein [Paraglaciecola sp.]|uniref:glycoside hydrolase family 9 protein n=1 Tax=Paraglaciecola sp. TaxID=1920173 RepID=UPI0030F48200